MQSSTAVACRVLVMLVCLIAVPLAAILGSSLSDVARSLFGGRWGNDSGPAQESLAEAPRLGTPSEMVGALTGPLNAPEEVAECARPASPGSATPAGVIHAGLEVPLQSVPADRSPPFVWSRETAREVAGQAADPAARRPPRSRLAELFPIAPPAPRSADSSTRDLRSAPSASGAPMAELPPPPAAASDSRAIAIQQRLRQLGAPHCLLEPWGSRGQLFRFHCKVAIGGNPNWTRYFEATDADPLQAMTRVLEEVEAWRARGG